MQVEELLIAQWPEVMAPTRLIWYLIGEVGEMNTIDGHKGVTSLALQKCHSISPDLVNFVEWCLISETTQERCQSQRKVVKIKFNFASSPVPADGLALSRAT